MNNLEDGKFFCLHFENGIHKRMIIVSVRQPGPFRVFCTSFIFNNIELTIEKTNEKIPVSHVVGIQRIPNQNIPEFELTPEGLLKEIPK